MVENLIDIKLLADALLSISEDQSRSTLEKVANTILAAKKKPLATPSAYHDPGIYVIFSADGNVLYIGESGNLSKRHKDLYRTQNHSFRRSYGNYLFSDIAGPGSSVKSGKDKFLPELEVKLTEAMDKLFFVEVPVHIGRKEIEEYLIEKIQNDSKASKYLFNIKERRR